MVKVHLRVVIAFYQKRIVTDFARFGARQLFYSCFRQHIPKHEFSHMMASSTSEMLKCPSFHLFCTKYSTREYACRITGELYYRHDLWYKKLRNIYFHRK